MAVYLWCTACQSREESCSNVNSHRAQRVIQYRSDFVLGGRYGKRIRKLFAVKKDAENYEHVTITDFKRGVFLPDTAYKSKKAFVEFSADYKAYIKHRMRGYNVEEYRIGLFDKYFNTRPVHTIHHSDIEKYIQERLNLRKEKTTINREITTLKVMFKWAVDTGYLLKSPIQNIKKFKVETILIRWLDDAEITKMLRACDILQDLDMKDLLVVALNTGFRKSNLERLTGRDVLNNKLQATKTKSGKPYHVPINNVLADTLRRLIKEHGSSVPLLNFKNYRRRFELVVKEAGLWRADKDPDAVSLHTFRHTFAAQCLRRGIEINVVCEWLGHYSIEFTRRHYGHLCPKREESLINLLNLGGSIVDTSLTSTILENIKVSENA